MTKHVEETILQKKLGEITRIAEKINAPEWFLGEYSIPKRVLLMKIRARIGGKMEHFQVILVMHCNPYRGRPYKGGIRFHLGVTQGLLTVFGIDMTEKCALAGLRFGGAKAGIAIDPRRYSSRDLCEITEQMTFEMLKDNIPDPDIYVPGPDAGFTPQTISWMLGKLDEVAHVKRLSNVIASVTGKSLEDGGIPLREEATARGVLIQTRQFLNLTGKNLRTLAVQGFGNVGGNTVRLAPEFGFTVNAVSDEYGGITNPHGLDFGDVVKWHAAHGGTFENYPEADHITNEELLALPGVDILIPAAMEEQITETNAARVRASLVVEGANEAITHRADEILFDNGTPVIPGISANTGGVAVSSLEWRKNRGDRPHSVDFADDKAWVLKELKAIMENTLHTVYHRSIALRSSLTEAAHIIAMETVLERLKEKHIKYL